MKISQQSKIFVYSLFCLFISISFIVTVFTYNQTPPVTQVTIKSPPSTSTVKLKVYKPKALETTIQCRGDPYNQSCLFKNLYYADNAFTILTVNGSNLPSYSIRRNAFETWDTPFNKRIFNTYSELKKFVRENIRPKMIPSLTLHFCQSWHYNIGHALFDGLYPAYVGLIRFAPRHLQPFRILAGVDICNDCWSEDVYGRFGGLGILNLRVLEQMSKGGRWFVFEELVMGSGTMCQRCNQPNLQLPGGVELDAARLFRDRMYQQHGLLPTIVRKNSSAQHRTARDILQAFIIDNKRFTDEDRKQLNHAINEINNYTSAFRNRTTKLQWPLINVTYLHYGHIKAQNSSIQINANKIDARPPAYELVDNNFIAQLKVLQQMDIHIAGPGTGQMYQTFLSDGSVNINLGGLGPVDHKKGNYSYTSFMEQHMTSGAPYIKGLYYPINERPKGIKTSEVVKLIRQAGQLIFNGFSMPVNPRKNLAPDGQLFVEMCQRDQAFCSLVTKRSGNTSGFCLNLWVEDFVHENGQWSEAGLADNGKNISCPFNHTLLRELRIKYNIKHDLGP